ncbi:MAG: cobyrinate a,c-diamide synthase [Eubacteriaceae bacterium]|nr:cobyrinate a,c-diamide synthase [Eubacteriaceae bacterium]
MGKRIMFAATGSGSGKTTLTSAFLAALVSMGEEAAAFKCGPDYVDPMFHTQAAGVATRNLDIYLMGEEGVARSLATNTEGKISVIEGVMGLYDGMGNTSYASSNHVSLATNTPVVLIANPKGEALSVCALIKGFLDFEANNIKAVLLNNVTEGMYRFYKDLIEERIGIKVVGYMPKVAGASIESRHLGLFQPSEIEDLKEKIALLAENFKNHVDIGALMEIASQAPPLDAPERPIMQPARKGNINLYVSSDEAFSFWYEDNHELFETLGANIRFFSPIHDSALPADADGVVFWGGYPELYGKELEANVPMRNSIKTAADAGIPIYAECGGYRYLLESLEDMPGGQYSMAGVLEGSSRMGKQLQNFGYGRMEAARDNLLCKAGESINAHFFTYAECFYDGDCFIVTKHNGNTFSAVRSQGSVFAGNQHLHFWGNKVFAENFINLCFEYNKTRSKAQWT